MTYRLAMVAMSLSLLNPSTGSADEPYRFVSSRDGQIQGVVESGIASFKGIPYATAPTGEMRWRAPRPPAPWSSILVADKYGSACLQPSMPGRAKQESVSEDCLTLNVFSPTSLDDRKLPVMFWIHGGSFVTGAGGNAFYDGALLANHGVVVVTINYRLGRFGWFAHPALTKAANGEPIANYGMLDQIAALKWVRDNIDAFGGDPNNVTIFGESAGAMCVNLLMTSPLANNLFHKAISESGLGREPAHSLEAEEELGAEFADSLGVKNDDVGSLRQLAADAILGHKKEAPKGSRANYGPIIDGNVVPRDVAAAFADLTTRPIPFIIGTNDDEATLYPQIREHPELVLARSSADLVALGSPYSKTAENPAELAAQITTDEMFTEPARFLARNHAIAGAPTFRYLFSYVPQEKRPNVKGAGHGHEIQFVFGNLGARGGGSFSSADRNMSEDIMLYWTNFAKTGNPNGKGLPAWPDYRRGGDRTLLIRSNGFRIANDPDGSRLDFIQSHTQNVHP